MRHDAKHLGKFGDFRAATAKLAWYADLDEARFLEQLVVLGDESIARVELGCSRGKGWCQCLGNLDRIAGWCVICIDW